MSMHLKAKIIAPSYVLGELQRSWKDIDEWDATAKKLSIPPAEELWAWGSVWTTHKSQAQLAVESVKKTLQRSDCQPEHIDCVIFCSADFSGDVSDHANFMSEVLNECAISNASLLGMTLGRCATFLQGLKAADALVRAQEYQCVLVVTADVMKKDSDRLSNFALFSDGAASCLIVPSTSSGTGFSIAATGESNRLRHGDGELSSELSKAVNIKIFQKAGIEIQAVERVFHTNIYLPICVLKEVQAGFKHAQLFTNNIQRIGHCFAADPLINFVDYIESNTLGESTYYLLAASVPGTRVAILLRKESGE